MGPEHLVALSVLGGALMVGLSLWAGYAARGALASAVEALLRREVDELRASLDRARQDASRQRDASGLVLDAARRRADLDPAADPAGLGLLLGADLDPGPDPSGGEAPGGDSARAGAGPAGPAV